MLTVTCIIWMCGVVLSADALTCRTDGGPKEEQLKQLYTNCLRSQSDKNSSNSREYSSNNRREHRERDNYDNNSSKEKRKPSQQWDRKSDGFGSRDDWSGGSSDWSSRNRDRTSGTSGSRDDWGSGSNSGVGSSGAGKYGRMPMDGGQDRMSSSRDRGMNGRDDYKESPDYGDDMSRYNNNFRSSTQSSRRMKREKSSGHRSQYNPNASPRMSNNGYRNERNSTENTNSTQDDSMQACALHCFLEELDMTGENGMPDRYLVTHVLTKDVKNEDLRDFLQESTDECFRIIYNENSQDKCDFSKNLLMCLSEKGRANCDDWRDDLRL